MHYSSRRKSRPEEGEHAYRSRSSDRARSRSRSRSRSRTGSTLRSNNAEEGTRANSSKTSRTKAASSRRRSTSSLRKKTADTICNCEDCLRTEPDQATTKRKSRGNKAVILLLEDKEEDDNTLTSMWKLDLKRNPIKLFVPQPKGCLSRKRKRGTKEKHVQFDRAWVHYYEEEPGEKFYGHASNPWYYSY